MGDFSSRDAKETLQTFMRMPFDDELPPDVDLNPRGRTGPALLRVLRAAIESKRKSGPLSRAELVKIHALLSPATAAMAALSRRKGPAAAVPTAKYVEAIRRANRPVLFAPSAVPTPDRMGGRPVAGAHQLEALRKRAQASRARKNRDLVFLGAVGLGRARRAAVYVDAEAFFGDWDSPMVLERGFVCVYNGDQEADAPCRTIRARPLYGVRASAKQLGRAGPAFGMDGAVPCPQFNEFVPLKNFVLWTRGETLGIGDSVLGVMADVPVGQKGFVGDAEVHHTR